MKSGGGVGQAYFWRPMVILDAIDLNSTRLVFNKKDDIANSTCRLRPGDGNAVKKDVIKGHLAWADARCLSSLFVSDAFLEILSSRQIDDFSTRYILKEV
ncbi:imm11 family protein [Enterovibrio norvegicus]|uniref:imm11 family protein n=1 Tax=Enterovibrio norvegicus TaxID=188144 RepID=UPI003D0F4F80